MRVLRGIGGEQVFLARYRSRSEQVRRAGVRVALPQSTLDSAQVLLPGIFVVIVTWLGARLAVEGTISPGELVAFYGYAAFLVIPLRTAAETVDKVTRAYVGANRMLEILRIEPQVAEPSAPAVEPPPGLPLTDRRAAGFVVGRAAHLHRLQRCRRKASSSSTGSVASSTTTACCSAASPRVAAARGPCGGGSWSVRPTPMLSPARCRRSSTPWARATEAQVLAAIAVANAEDVLDAPLKGSPGSPRSAGARSSGGQRQRLVLARALLARRGDPAPRRPDERGRRAHRGEDRAAAARGEARTHDGDPDGKPPLVLDQAERVALEDGVVAAIGTHRELLQSSPAYRWTVTREKPREWKRAPAPTGRGPRPRGRALPATSAPLIVVLGLHGSPRSPDWRTAPARRARPGGAEDGTTTSHVDSVQ